MASNKYWPSNEKLAAFNRKKKDISRAISEALLDAPLRPIGPAESRRLILRDLKEAVRPENRAIEDGDLFIENVEDTYRYVLAYTNNSIIETLLHFHDERRPFLYHDDSLGYANTRFLIIGQDIFAFTTIDKELLHTAYDNLLKRPLHQGGGRQIIRVEKADIGFEVTLENIRDQRLTRTTFAERVNRNNITIASGEVRFRNTPTRDEISNAMDNAYQFTRRQVIEELKESSVFGSILNSNNPGENEIKWDSNTEGKKNKLDSKQKEKLKRKIDL